MSKVKYVPVLLAALALIFLGAFLPRLVAAAGDEAILGKAGFDQMQSMEFELHKNIPSMGKLAMMANLNSAVEIQASKASMTEQEAMEASRSALRAYVDAGLLAEYSEWQVTTRAYLASGGTANGVFWIVEVYTDAEALRCIQTIVDDETGALLGVRAEDQQYRGSELRTEYMYMAADLFFSGLGIDSYSSFAEDELKGDSEKGNTALRYRFGDAVYGEVNVDVCVWQYGFYVEVLQSEVAVYAWD